MKVLMITSEYPTEEAPYSVPFIARQVRFLKKQGIEITVFSFRGAKNPFNYFKTFFKVQKVLRSDSFDLVHAQFGQSGIFTVCNRIPQVVTFRGSDLEGIIGENGQYTLSGRILQAISGIVARKAKALILVAERMATYLPEGKSYSVIPSGLDMEMFRPMDQATCRRQLGWPLESKIAIFGGRPSVPRKRYWLAKAAIQHTRNQVELKPLEDVTPETVPVMMNAADLLLLTSVHEGSPNVVKEALACNTPIVSVPVGDVPQRLKEVAGCYLCSGDTPQEIARGIDQVLTNNSEFQGRKHVEDLNEALLTEKVIDIYKSITQNQTL